MTDMEQLLLLCLAWGEERDRAEQEGQGGRGSAEPYDLCCTKYDSAGQRLCVSPIKLAPAWLDTGRRRIHAYCAP